MMRNRSNLLLMGIVLLLGLYAYFGEYKREIHEEKEKKESARIVRFSKDVISKIQVITKGETVELVKTIDGWNIEAPFKDQADSEALEDQLQSLLDEKIVDRIKQTESLDLSDYGLQDPVGKIVFTTNAGESQAVMISSKRNFENLQFVQIDGKGDVLTTGDTWFSFLGRPASQFRDLRVFRKSLSKVNTLKVKNKSGEFALINKEARWVPQKGSWELDQNEVRSILTQLSQARATEVASQVSGVPLMKIEIGLEDKKWSANFFIEPDSKQILAQISDPKLNLKLSPETLDRLKDLTLFDLRDRTLPFDFDKAKVARIEWSSSLKKQALEKSTNGWKIDPPDAQFQIDPKAGDLLIDKIRNLKVYRYRSTSPSQVSFKNYIELKGADRSNIFKLEWSDFNDFEAWARVSTTSEVFQMDDAQISRLGLSEIIRAIPEVKESNAKY